MNSSLLATKFHVPIQRAGLVERSRLLEELQRGWDENHKLTLISAPAGYGKTTLVTGWLSLLQSKITNQKVQISWLSLDDADNDSARFLRYVLTTFKQVGVSLSERTLSVLEIKTGQMSAHEKVLPALPSLLDDLLSAKIGGGQPVTGYRPR